MNPLSVFLARHAERLELGTNLAERLAFVVVTPRFRASRHVVFLGVLPESVEPVLVAKLPRLRNDRSGIAREAEILSALHARRAHGFDSIPRLIALDDSIYPLLLETALRGQPLTSADVRRRPNECIHAVLVWLSELHGLERRPRTLDRFGYEELVERPLRRFCRAFGPGSPEDALVERTLKLLDGLADAGLPRVCEHGDLSEPNLLRLPDGRLGVVDWELAVLDGLPAQDLCFFLTYVAFSRERERTLAAQRQAFHQAFGAPEAWARPIVGAQLQTLGVDPGLAVPLLVACFARQTAALLGRISGLDDDGSVSTAGWRDDDARARRTRAWIRQNRYYSLWEHALGRIE